MEVPNLHLITHVLCPYVQRSIITLEEKNVAYTRTDIDLANKPPWFKQRSPMGKVPVLVVDETSTLFESAVICEYINDVTPGSLHPADSLEKAYHRAWIEFGSSILSNIAKFYSVKEPSTFQTIHAEMKSQFRWIEAELSDSEFFAGEIFHLIDAVYGPIFRYFDVFDTFMDLDTLDNLPKCHHWRQALMQRDSIQKAVSENYTDDLIDFLSHRESYMSQLIQNKISISKK